MRRNIYYLGLRESKNKILFRVNERPKIVCNMHCLDPMLMYHLLQIIENSYFVLFRCEHRQLLCA
jgi:hypothetical protein